MENSHPSLFLLKQLGFGADGNFPSMPLLVELAVFGLDGNFPCKPFPRESVELSAWVEIVHPSPVPQNQLDFGLDGNGGERKYYLF